MNYSQTPACGKAKADDLHLNAILRWIFGGSIDNIKMARSGDARRSNMAYAK